MAAKRRVGDLALFGGSPAFRKELHVGRPNIGNRRRLIGRINDILDEKWLTNNGPYVREFEKRVADAAGVKHCVAVCNGTMGLEIAARAMGLSGEVIVPAMTFIASAHILQWSGITPVFCDIDGDTHNIDPSRIEALITPRTTGILAVHLWGRPCDVEVLAAIAGKHRLKLLYDAAHAFGCCHKKGKIGGFGNAEVFSFHATKVVNAFEGGAIVTNDSGLDREARLIRNFGFEGYDNVVRLGINAKMTEVFAAMGLTSLESMDRFVSVNIRNYRFYKKGLEGIPGVRLMAGAEDGKSNHQYIVVEIDEAAAGVSRDIMVEILWKENLLARRYFYPGCHRMEPYCSRKGHDDLRLPVTDAVLARVMQLPSGTAVGKDDIAGVCDLIRFIVSHGGEIRGRLKRTDEKNK